MLRRMLKHDDGCAIIAERAGLAVDLARYTAGDTTVEHGSSVYGAWVEYWGGGDQEVLTAVLLSEMKRSQFTLCKLMEYDKYCGEADYKTGLPKQDALIDQWMMNRRMRMPQKKWPPPEWARRRLRRSN